MVSAVKAAELQWEIFLDLKIKIKDKRVEFKFAKKSFGQNRARK